MRDDRAADDFVDVLALEPEPVDDTVQRRRHHLEIREIGIKRVGPAERDTDTADHRNAPKLSCHLDLQCFPSPRKNVERE